MDDSILSQLPPGEICWVRRSDPEKGLTHIITSTRLRDKYFLYEIIDNKLQKTSFESDNPLDLEVFISEGNPSCRSGEILTSE